MPPSSSSDIVTPIKLLRSPVSSKRPNPSVLLDGQPAINFNSAEPGLYFADSSHSELIKIGPCHVSADPPNNTPIGYPGNCVGEFWLDISEGSSVLKVWDGTEWVPTGSVTPPGPGGDYIEKSIINSKGDLIVGRSNDLPNILAVGSNGQVLTVDSSQVLGVKWANLPNPGIQESIIAARGDLIVGSANDSASILPVGSNNQVLTADSTQPLGVKWSSTSSSFTPTIGTIAFTTNELDPNEHQDFALDLGSLFHLISAGSSDPNSVWIRAYTSASGRTLDTRVLPGPPYPCSNTGFAIEVVTTSSNPVINFVPVPTFYTPTDFFFRVTNLEAIATTFDLEFKYTQLVP